MSRLSKDLGRIKHLRPAPLCTPKDRWQLWKREQKAYSRGPLREKVRCRGVGDKVKQMGNYHIGLKLDPSRGWNSKSTVDKIPETHSGF